MDAIREYLSARAAKPLTVGPDLVRALDLLAAAGTALDEVLVQAERVSAVSSRTEAGRFEQVTQTLGALSREAWTAHRATLTAVNALKQLADVEAAVAQERTDAP